MVIIHRATPFAIGLVTALLFTAVLLGWLPVAIGFPLLLLLPFLLFSRLCQWSGRTFQFWYFVGTPVVFLLSSIGFLLLLEDSVSRWALAGLAASLLFVFGELVFVYLHLPASYQPYSIEHLSLPMNILSVFFLSATFFGTNLFLQLPLPLLSIAFALVVMFLVFGTLWVSKVSFTQAMPYALAGTLLATQLFAVLTYLPTGYYTNAALLALYFYLFLGCTRAQSLARLSKDVVKRYVIFGALLGAVILGSARWI